MEAGGGIFGQTRYPFFITHAIYSFPIRTNSQISLELIVNNASSSELITKKLKGEKKKRIVLIKWLQKNEAYRISKKKKCAFCKKRMLIKKCGNTKDGYRW